MTEMKKIFFAILFLLTVSAGIFAQTTETTSPPEAVKPKESAKKEAVEQPPAKSENPGVKTVVPNNPEAVKRAMPKQGAKPEVVRPEKRRPAGAGRPAGVRRPPVRRIR
jgi:hypothetical protein